MTYDPTPAAAPVRQRRFDDATPSVDIKKDDATPSGGIKKAAPARRYRIDDEKPSADIENRAEQARSQRRLKAVKSARAVISSSGSGIDCVVRSMSPNGARLTFDEPVNLPERFELCLLTENVRVGVSQVWSKGLDVGVNFEKPLGWLSKHVVPKRF